MIKQQNQQKLIELPEIDKVKLDSSTSKTVVLGNYDECELIIGFVGAVGTKMQPIISQFIDQLTKNHGYHDNETIKVSKVFLEPIMREYITGKGEKRVHGSHCSKVEALMDVGNWLREKTDNGIVAMGVAAHIASKRNPSREPFNRKVFFVDSIKHPAEVELLRKIYGEGFYLVGVYEDKRKRLKNLSERILYNDDGMPLRKSDREAYAKKLIERDECEDNDFGQHTREAFQQSDFFIDITNSDSAGSINRFIDLVFGHPFFTPTFGEYAMYMAFSASLRSADLSRQVGAAVCRENDILAMGTNDVPKFGGGLYWMEVDKTSGEYKDTVDGRDYMVGFDSNKSELIKLSRDILQRLKIIEDKPVDDPLDISDIVEYLPIIKKSKLGDLTEYGRIVHAEMEALLSCARSNVSSCGSDMYVTTFPCHNCAKHIIAAGVRKIVYIEPYPKSKTFEFYSDSTTQDAKESGDKVFFTPFFGVGPSRFRDFFAMSNNPYPEKKRKEKDTGRAIEYNGALHGVRSQLLPVSYLDKEEQYLKIFEEYDRIIRKGVDSDAHRQKISFNFKKRKIIRQKKHTVQ